LYPADEKAEITEAVRNAAKSEGKAVDGTPTQLFSYFIERCIKKLHIVLCFSPIGDAFRNNVRNFPSLVNCTTIDWFSEWPSDALDSVAKRSLADIDMDDEVRIRCVEMVQQFHEQTVIGSKNFFD
jgi:dynein heavy chain